MPDGSATRLQTIAETVLACEAALIEEAGGDFWPSFLACDKLRTPLRKVFGLGGFRPLLQRALALAGSKHAWIQQLQVTTDGSLEGFGELDPTMERSEFAEGERVLIAELLGLLVTFIGPALTLSLLQDAWPPLAGVKFELGAL